ncbi:MAG: hypothetical protein DDT19_01623 [Syntrophomonadaceae bacterium]|nr:hypothetical protein [Bacillota bacterium]
MDERQAHIICICGEQIQRLKDKEVEPGIFCAEWDEEETRKIYQEHLRACRGRDKC